MIPLKSISPAIDEIVEAACAYKNNFKERKSLYATLQSAYNHGDAVARTHLEENQILNDGLTRVLEAGYQPSFVEYIQAVAIAARRIKRVPNELLYLKRLIVRNYNDRDQIRVMRTFHDIADELGDNGTNYLNYIIEELTEFSFAKKACKGDPDSQNEYFQRELEAIEEDITNGIHGFMFGYGSEMFGQTMELMHLAANTPLIPKRKERVLESDYHAYLKVRRGGF